VVASNKSHPWHKYLSKHLGRYKFQVDLAIDLISWGITMDWSGIEDINNKPVYMRKQDYVPCMRLQGLFLLQEWTYSWDRPQEER
jgi:hypothetical protein